MSEDEWTRSSVPSPSDRRPDQPPATVRGVNRGPAMSFLARLFGTELNGLSDTQKVELKRLKAVAMALGETRSTLGLKGLSGLEQIHLINRRLGERLGGSTAQDRAASQRAFPEADRV